MALPRGDLLRITDEQGDADQLVVQRVAVRLETMLEKRGPVIRRDDDDRCVEQLPLLELVQNLAEVQVRPRNLAVVQRQQMLEITLWHVLVDPTVREETLAVHRA